MEDERHLYEDGFVMLFEDGSQMLLETSGGIWTQQPTDDGVWVEQPRGA